MKISEKEALWKKYKQLQARENQEQYSTTNNNNGIWKTAVVVVGFGLLVGIFGTVLYLVGQNSVKNNRCKC